MIHFVDAGKHRERLTFRALLDRLPWFSLSGRPVWQRTVTFTDSCRYTLPGVEQLDVNKIGGLSFGGGPHGTSARFGWRYNPSDDCVDIFAYCYNAGQRHWEKSEWAFMASVRIDQPVKLRIAVRWHGVELAALAPEDEDWLTMPVRLTWWQRHVGLRLGLWFGGTLPCPHRMEVEMI